ncbi:MAG: MMPL family transporter [Nakamurella sp.]
MDRHIASDTSVIDSTRPRASRRLRWLIPAVITIAWLILGSVSGPFAGKLSEVASNDSASFLPASAESTQVQNEQQAFTRSKSFPAIVVAQRTSGITDADTMFLNAAAKQITTISGIKGSTLPPAQTSTDGQAVQLIVPIDQSANPADAVEAIRSDLSNPPDGLTVLVTGPAGLIADLGSAFSGIDGLLLIVAGSFVALILLVVYRSVLLPFLVLLSAVFALGVASLVVYILADNDVLALDGQSQGILSILVIGAATDYALLLVSRFREQLRDTDNRVDAMMTAWRATLAPITASAATVILAVLCLLFSDLNSNRGLGPVAAIGIGAAWLASITFLPAVLAVLGRSAFWPLRPKLGSTHPETRGIWGRIARLVSRRPRTIWSAATVLLLIGVAFLPTLQASGTSQSEILLNKTASVTGQQILGQHFPGGTGSPTVTIANRAQADQVLTASRVPGVSSSMLMKSQSGQPVTVDGRVEILTILDDPAGSEQAVSTVRQLRQAVHAVANADARVGGPTAAQLDTQQISERDRSVIIPIVLVVIFLVLALLLRALLAPLLLLGTVVLSFAATLGVSALVFNHIFHFPGADPVVPLFGFVFLVALGIDYNIFLMTRVREEAVKHGTREGTRRGLALTGGVITSAGVVLAATFSALAVLPILFLAQIAFIVAFGVLLDTIIVRSLLVPSLTIDIGRRIWWPSKLAQVPDDGQDVSTMATSPGTRHKKIEAL